MYKCNPLTWKFDLVTDISTKADLVDWKVPVEQLPSYVDDVIEVANFAALPLTGEQWKIYVTLDDNKNYRWSGSTYILLNPVDLSNYYNKTETDTIVSWTQLNTNIVLLSANTTVNTSVYPRNTTFVCSGDITIEINPELSNIGTEYTFINWDGSVITLNQTAGKAIWNYKTSNYILINKGQTVTLFKRSDLMWDFKSQFTDWNRKKIIDFRLSSSSLSNWYQIAGMNTIVADTWMLSTNEETSPCLSYNSSTKTFTVNKGGWYEVSWYFIVNCYFSSTSSFLKTYLEVENWTFIRNLGIICHQIGSAPETLAKDKYLSFSSKIYLNKNFIFKFGIDCGSWTISPNLSSLSTVVIEYLGDY